MAKHGDVVRGHRRAKQKPSGRDDIDDPGGNERMAKTSVSFAGQLRGPALDGGDGGSLAGASGLGLVVWGAVAAPPHLYKRIRRNEEIEDDPS
jgi:hypothetical protein